jgi:shikimate kinase
MTTEHLFLVGPMGAGKSTIGKQLANILGRPFFDIDVEIVKSTGADIQWIFDMEGEEGFRQRESAMLLRTIASSTPSVIATGGGIVLRSDNRNAMVEAGKVVYLWVTKQQLYERTKRDKKRPLLQVEDRKTAIDLLYEQRDPLYREIADIVFRSSSFHAQQVATELADQLSVI